MGVRNLKKNVSISEFDGEIGSYSMYDVVQSDPIEHIFISASFSQVHVLPAKLYTLLFKNDSCEVHIHNILEVSKSFMNGATVYTLRCADSSTPTHGRQHVCSVTCR